LVKSTPRGERRQLAILEAARDLFVERGFDAVSVDEIVARAGGSKATVYRAFGSKEGLFEALIGSVNREIADNAGTVQLDETLPPREALLAYARTAAASILTADLAALYRLAVAETPRFPEIGRRFWQAGPGPASALLADYIGRRQKAGVFRPGDPSRLADRFYAMLVDRPVIAISLGILAPPDAAWIAAHAEEVVDHYLVGIAA
jgi:AcrR family transcriptional regulator